MLNKIQVLDSLRAFAALAVCLFHFIYTTKDFVDSETLLSFFYNGKYGVQMFFVISGFVIPWAMFQKGYRIADFFVFLFKRLARLEPPYLFSLLLALALLFFRERILNVENTHLVLSVKGVMLHLGYLIPFFKDYQWLNQVYWSLAVEFQYYFFMALVYVPLVSMNIYLRIICYVLFVGASFLTNQYFLPFWLPVFLLGIVLFLFKTKTIRPAEYYITTLLLLIFIGFRLNYMIAVFSALPVLFVLKWPNLKPALLHSMGKWSYSLYLVHPLLGASVINVLSHWSETPVEKVLVLIVGLLVTFLSSYVMYLFVEKPSKNFSANIKYSRSHGRRSRPEAQHVNTD